MEKGQTKTHRSLVRHTLLCCTATLASITAAQLYAQSPSNTTEAIDYEPVNVHFNKKGCPKFTNPQEVELTKARRVVWQAVDFDGNPIKERYEIYFDPFKGQPLRANEQGELKSPQVDPDAPTMAAPGAVEYKYSIVGERCKDKPLDPRIRLRR